MSQPLDGEMRALDANERDDLLLVVLLLVVAIPRTVLAVLYDRPIGVEGTLALLCCGLALMVLAGRARRRNLAREDGETPGA